MAEYSNEELGVRFTIPDTLTVRQQLRYRSQTAFFNRADAYERFWEGAKELIGEWECEALPNLKPTEDGEALNLDEVSDTNLVDIIFWVCNAVSGHLARLEAEAVEKNS